MVSASSCEGLGERLHSDSDVRRHLDIASIKVVATLGLPDRPDQSEHEGCRVSPIWSKLGMTQCPTVAIIRSLYSGRLG